MNKAKSFSSKELKEENEELRGRLNYLTSYLKEVSDFSLPKKILKPTEEERHSFIDEGISKLKDRIDNLSIKLDSTDLKSDERVHNGERIKLRNLLAETKKLEWEQKRIENEIAIQEIDKFPLRTWPKSLVSIGVVITSGTLSLMTYLSTQGFDMITFAPLITFGICLFGFGLYFWIQDDDLKRRIYYRKLEGSKSNRYMFF